MDRYCSFLSTNGDILSKPTFFVVWVSKIGHVIGISLFIVESMVSGSNVRCNQSLGIHHLHQSIRASAVVPISTGETGHL